MSRWCVARWRQLNCGRDDELLAQVAAARNKGANGAAAVVFRREPGWRGARGAAIICGGGIGSSAANLGCLVLDRNTAKTRVAWRLVGH
jgi:hypothetical protein